MSLSALSPDVGQAGSGRISWPRLSRPADPSQEGALTAAQVASWREQGFALVDGLLPPDLVERAREDATAAFPAPGSAAAEEVTV